MCSNVRRSLKRSLASPHNVSEVKANFIEDLLSRRISFQRRLTACSCAGESNAICELSRACWRAQASSKLPSGLTSVFFVFYLTRRRQHQRESPAPRWSPPRAGRRNTSTFASIFNGNPMMILNVRCAVWFIGFYQRSYWQAGRQSSRLVATKIWLTQTLKVLCY